MNKLIVIDAYSLIYKAYYAIREMTTSTGIPTNAVYGFVNMLLKLLAEQEPDCIVAAFDTKAPTFRHEIYEAYKAHRQKMPEDLAVQIEYIRQILDKMGVMRTGVDGYEGDDLLASYARLAKQKGLSCVLVTGDKDSFQLVDENTTVYYAKRGVSDIVVVDEAYIAEQYTGINPKQLIDVKALMGDKSDNIPGVAGIGEKTALKLVGEYGSLDGIYENIDQHPQKLQEKLLNGREIAYQSYALAAISDEVPVEDCTHYEGIADPDGLLDIFEHLQLRGFIKKLALERSEESAAEQETVRKAVEVMQVEAVGVEKVEADIIASREVFLYYQQSQGELDLLLFQTDGGVYGVQEPMLLKAVIQVLDKAKALVVHDKKTLLNCVAKYGVHFKNMVFDIYLAAYIIDATDGRYDLATLGMKYLGYELEQNAAESQLSFLSATPEVTGLGMYAEAVGKLYELFQQKLSQMGAETLYGEIELPLARVLHKMEREGVTIDVEALNEIGARLEATIEEMEHKIREIADKGPAFNIYSPKQLGDFLFNDLNLPVIKKTKTGYSTDIEVLEALKGEHRVIEMIIELRKAAKLHSTYVKGLLALVDAGTRKIHTTFNQTVTTTGRISSSEPNLQNIPVKTPEGRILRKAFVACDENHVLIDADYSQIELRVLADISQDENLIQAFIEDKDIHTITASEVFDVPLEMVTSSMRSRAKAVNFGIVYGISDYGLSRDLNISRKEAKMYIDRYLAHYSGVKQYMADIVDFAREHRYVETKFNRRRYIPKIDGRNFNERSFAERTAMNTPIQGTAADIIKIAMIRVDEALEKNKLKSRLILQVHDELIIQAPLEEESIAYEILVYEMKNAAQLSVPLKVDIHTGRSWYDSK